MGMCFALPLYWGGGGILANDELARWGLCGRTGRVGKRQDLTLSFAASLLKRPSALAADVIGLGT